MKVFCFEVAMGEPVGRAPGQGGDVIEESADRPGFLCGCASSQQERNRPVKPFPDLGLDQRIIVVPAERGDLGWRGFERLKTRDQSGRLDVAPRSIAIGQVEQGRFPDVFEQLDSLLREAQCARWDGQTVALQKGAKRFERRLVEPGRWRGFVCFDRGLRLVGRWLDPSDQGPWLARREMESVETSRAEPRWDRFDPIAFASEIGASNLREAYGIALRLLGIDQGQVGHDQGHDRA